MSFDLMPSSQLVSVVNSGGRDGELEAAIPCIFSGKGGGILAALNKAVSLGHMKAPSHFSVY